MHSRNCVFLLLIFVAQLNVAEAFTDYLLKKCAQSGFCHRNREYARNIQRSHNSYYSIDQQSINYDSVDSVFRATIVKSIHRPDRDDATIYLPFTLSFLREELSVRFTIDEIRHHNITTAEHIACPTRYNETAKWGFTNTSVACSQQAKVKKGWFYRDVFTFKNIDNSIKIEVHTKSFQLKVFYGGHLSMVINDRSLFNVEHFRLKKDNYRNLLPEESSFNMFADDFEYSRKDSLPLGPESVALDFTFRGYQNVYGIPEHADSLRLKDTSNGDPYRLFNVDVFEYNLHSTFPMYGAIPLMIASKPRSSVGLFWVNAADSWVDIEYSRDDTKTHWMSETGIIDVVLFFGQQPSDITEKFTALTGRPALPPLSSIGYHQCRWNYNDELDVMTVDSEMDRAQIPYDFIWLDLEYTDSKKFFTWKPDSFPNPERMLKRLAKLGRQLTVLIDPHLKEGYNISKIVVDSDVAVQDCEGRSFIGHCWPGKSVWIDTFNPIGQKIWDGFLKKFVKGMKNLNIWNDMNEPSVFSGPETTAPKDLIHYGGFEERSVHNLYGLTVHQSTYESMKEIHSKENLRPFVLTRSFFAGSQRTAATWTGDNVATWEYLKISIPMCLTSNIAGMPFIGADISGFSGNPEKELIARWYQAGLWYPFFRGHAHIDTERREPYLFPEPLKTVVRDAIQLRYTLLPTLYSLFHKSSVDGSPIMRPMFYEKPNFLGLYGVDDQFYVGDSGLLVKPVLEKGAREVDVLLTPGVYYHYPSLKSLVIQGSDIEVRKLDAPLHKIPVLLEGGHIIFTKEKYRRSSKLLRNDAYTIVVAPDKMEDASGSVYVDDGETFNFESGDYLQTKVSLTKGKVLSSNPIHVPSKRNGLGSMLVDKIIFPIGRMTMRQTVKVRRGLEVYDATVSREGPSTVAILYPSLSLDEEWEIFL